MRIINATILTMENEEVYQNGYVDMENGIITGVGNIESAPAYTGDKFNAQCGYILPGFIDAHTHVGISEEGLRWEGEDCNETTDPITPDMRATDGFNPFDTAIVRARRAGVTTAIVSPGSSNVIGGQAVAIKLAGINVERMILKDPCAIKFALGENPKRNYGERKGKSPMTRMAVATIMRRTLSRAKRYFMQKQAGEDLYNPELEALLPLINREIPAHFHAHRSDDILTAMRIAREFQLRYNIIHATQAESILPELSGMDSIPVIGPSMGPAGKPEAVGSSFATAGLLNCAGLEVAITTDHDVTPLWLLPFFAAMCVNQGMDEMAALRAITINAAKVGGVDDMVGSISVGKHADIVLFSGHPFHYMTKPLAVFIDGIRKD